MKSLLLTMLIWFPFYTQDKDVKDIWGQKNAHKEPLFDKPVHHHSKAYKKEQEKRARADAIAVMKHAKNSNQNVTKGSPPLADFEVHYLEMVRVNKIRECRLEQPVTNFDILVRHRWDRNFAGSTLGYRTLNGNSW